LPWLRIEKYDPPARPEKGEAGFLVSPKIQSAKANPLAYEFTNKFVNILSAIANEERLAKE
jgi:hypothetical protein